MIKKENLWALLCQNSPEDAVLDFLCGYQVCLMPKPGGYESSWGEGEQCWRGRIVQMFGMNISSEQEQQKWNFFCQLGGGWEHCRNVQSPWPYFFHSEPSVGINRIPEPGGGTIPWMEPGAEPLSSGLCQTWKILLSFEPSSASLMSLWAEVFFCISNYQD